jgi:hypothetical protein
MLPKWLLTLSAVSQLLFGLSAVRQARGDNAGAQRPLREATEIAAAEPTMRGYGEPCAGARPTNSSRGTGRPRLCRIGSRKSRRRGTRMITRGQNR